MLIVRTAVMPAARLAAAAAGSYSCRRLESPEQVEDQIQWLLGGKISSEAVQLACM